jgi:hypothetical protein
MSHWKSSKEVNGCMDRGKMPRKDSIVATKVGIFTCYAFLLALPNKRRILFTFLICHHVVPSLSPIRARTGNVVAGIININMNNGKEIVEPCWTCIFSFSAC